MTVNLTDRAAFLEAIGLRVVNGKARYPQPMRVRAYPNPPARWHDSKAILRLKVQRESHPCIHWDGIPTGRMCGIGQVYGCAVWGQCSYCTRDMGVVHSCVMCREYSEKLTPTAFKRIRTKPLTWAVGMTTAPRAVDPRKTPLHADSETRSKWKSGPAIEWTLASLDHAGFSDVTVFAEPGSHRPESGYAKWVERLTQFGSWKNWKAALDQLLTDNPEAEAILLAQDDCIFCTGIREFLDQILWPDHAGVVSLYGSGKHANNQGLRTVKVGMFWGALALIFPRDKAIELLRSPIPNRLSGNQIDIRVGRWCRSSGYNLWVFTPSLAQHIGEFRSTMRHGGGRFMHAYDFVGENFDARTLIKKEIRSIAVVVPVFGCGEQAAKCIGSLAHHCSGNDITLWLVDNAGPASDFNAARLAADFSGLAYEIIKNETNAGFTAAVNQVIRATPNSHVLVLNSDAYVQNDVTRLLLAHLDSNPKIGAIGPLEYNLDRVGPYNDIRHRPGLIRFYGQLPHDVSAVAQELETMPPFFEQRTKIAYFCTLLRREAIDAVGMLDERLVSGYGADDLHCDRMLQGGWLVGVAHNAIALHEGSASFKAANLPKTQIQHRDVKIYQSIKREMQL